MRRKEDARVITGQTRWTDNLTLPGLLHLAIVRSPLAHARITGADVSAALERPGVVAAFTGRGLAPEYGSLPTAWNVSNDLIVPGHLPIATEEVHHLGDAVAVPLLGRYVYGGPVPGTRSPDASGYEVSCVQLENEFTVPAPVSEVWKTLLDVQRIAPCMPGPTGSEPTEAPAATLASTQERAFAPSAAAQASESLDLMSTVAMPVLKRLAPVVAGVMLGLIFGMLLGHRRRIVIMTAPAPPGTFPPTRAMP